MRCARLGVALPRRCQLRSSGCGASGGRVVASRRVRRRRARHCLLTCIRLACVVSLLASLRHTLRTLHPPLAVCSAAVRCALARLSRSIAAALHRPPAAGQSRSERGEGEGQTTQPTQAHTARESSAGEATRGAQCSLLTPRCSLLAARRVRQSRASATGP